MKVKHSVWYNPHLPDGVSGGGAINSPAKMLGVALGAAALSLVFILTVQRLPGAEPVQPRFEAAWQDSFEPAILKKSDRLVSTEPRSVVAERVMPDTPVKLPPVLAPWSPKPKAVHRRHAKTDICSRHHRRKVITNNGKSWRCR